MVKKILSIDGGGIRGIIPLLLLMEIEARLEEQNYKKLTDVFDLFAGTSTGGIIALGLAKQVPLEKLFSMYEGEEAKKIFKKCWITRFINNIPDHSCFSCIKTLYNGVTGLYSGLSKNAKYTSKGINNVLKDIFGEADKFGDLQKNVLITAYDTEKSRATFFTHFVNDKDSAYGNIPTWNIARATSAAPTYFEAHCFSNVYNKREVLYTCIDGGMVANNPAMCAYTEAQKQWPDEKEIIVVSLGTGTIKQDIPYEEIKKLKGINWIPKLISIFFDGMNDTIDYQLYKLNERNKQDMLDTLVKLDKMCKLYMQYKPDEPDVQDRLDKLNKLIKLDKLNKLVKLDELCKLCKPDELCKLDMLCKTDGQDMLCKLDKLNKTDILDIQNTLKRLKEILAKKNQYFRFQVDLTAKGSEELDNINDRNIQCLKDLANDAIIDPYKWKDKIDELIAIL